MAKQYSLFINGMYKEMTLGDSFSAVYFQYIDALRVNQSIPHYDIQIIYPETQAQVSFMLVDIIRACEKYAGWLGDMNYILLKSNGIGTLARKYLRNKLENKKFTIKLEEEARRKASGKH